MSTKAVLLALAAALTAAADEIDEAPAKPAAKPATPAPRAAVPAGKPVARGKGKAVASVDLDTLREKMTGYIKSHGKTKAVAVLTRHGVEKLPELDEKQYDDFNEYLDRCIADEVDPESEDGSSTSDEDLLG